MGTLPFKFIWLGQTVCSYEVPLDIFNTLNGIYETNFVNLDQITVNGIQYNDNAVGNNMHTIRTDKIMKLDNYYKSMIPKRFIKEYGHIRF